MKVKLFHEQRNRTVEFIFLVFLLRQRNSCTESAKKQNKKYKTKMAIHNWDPESRIFSKKSIENLSF